MKQLTFAIVGCGRISSRHVDSIIQCGGRLIATCDIKLDRAQKLAAPYGASTYSDLAAMLERETGHIDVISVCSPNGLHADHSIRALAAGCHVICEKPMALNVDECATMIKMAEHKNRRLFVVKQNRYNPPVVKVKDLLDKGELGRLYSLHLSCFWNRDRNYYQDDWKGTKSLDGGTLFTQFSHFIDLLLWLGGSIDSVHSYVGNFAHEDIIEFEDEGVAVVRFRSGALGTIAFSINAHKKNMEGSLTVIAERGTIKIGGQYLNELEYQSISGTQIEGLPKGAPANEYGHYQGSMSNHRQVYENVVDVLQNGAKMTTVGYEGLQTVDVITQIYRSARVRST